MKFAFSQIYPEVDTSFSLPGFVLKLFRANLDNLGLSIGKFRKKFGHDDFTLVLIISASRNRTELETKGPCILRKRPDIEFALHIPYKDFSDFSQEVSYVAQFVAKGINEVFARYEDDASGVEAAMQEAAATIERNPSMFENKWE
jgi:hypothetical protein